jgi:hypothetical protein
VSAAIAKPLLAAGLSHKLKIQMEKQIKMAAKLYECRDTAKAFFKEQYKEKLQPYTHILKQVMKANNLEEIPALLKISQTEHYQENGMAQMMYMAAVVELIEPSA